MYRFDLLLRKSRFVDDCDEKFAEATVGQFGKPLLRLPESFPVGSLVILRFSEDALKGSALVGDSVAIYEHSALRWRYGTVRSAEEPPRVLRLHRAPVTVSSSEPGRLASLEDMDSFSEEPFFCKLSGFCSSCC